jgi:hypothetical protein
MKLLITLFFILMLAMPTLTMAEEATATPAAADPCDDERSAKPPADGQPAEQSADEAEGEAN